MELIYSYSNKSICLKLFCNKWHYMIKIILGIIRWVFQHKIHVILKFFPTFNYLTNGNISVVITLLQLPVIRKKIVGTSNNYKGNVMANNHMSIEHNIWAFKIKFSISCLLKTFVFNRYKWNRTLTMVMLKTTWWLITHLYNLQKEAQLHKKKTLCIMFAELNVI